MHKIYLIMHEGYSCGELYREVMSAHSSELLAMAALEAYRGRGNYWIDELEIDPAV